MDNIQVYRGDTVKATPDGAFGGYLVRYSDPSTPDLYGDFFTASTFFGDTIRETKRLDAFYDHGFDGLTKRIPIGVTTLKFDDIGVWAETQIRISDEHFDKYGGEKRAKAIESAIKSLAASGKLGYSSGAVGHLVDYERVGDSNWIKSWVLGESSLTPRPAEPKNRVQSLKAFADTPPEVELTSVLKSGDGHEIHIHLHQTKEQITMSDKQETREVKNAPESDVLDIDALVADRVKAAMDEAAEKQRQAEAAKAAEEKRVEEEVEKRMKQFAVSRNSTVPYAIRTQGIREDSFPEAFKYFLASKGDTSGLKGMPGVDVYGTEWAISLDAVQRERANKNLPLIGTKAYAKSVKASNATDMNIGTAADGGSTVPTGFYNQIVMRRDEVALHYKLGCTSIPGVGTTVDAPLDNEADGEFVTASEANQFDQDAPAVTKVSLTLVKYTKRTIISDELLQDSGINILGYVQDRVAIGWGKTMNNLLVTEAVTGTQYKRGGTTTGYTFGELEDVVYNATVAPYLSDAGDIAWVGRAPSYGKIIQITGNDRQYGGAFFANDQASSRFNGNMLLGYPFHFSQKVDAIGARGKSLLFGAWSYMYFRESPSLNFLYDPYTRADYGQARLLWYIRTDFELAQSGAVGYFEHDLT